MKRAKCINDKKLVIIGFPAAERRQCCRGFGNLEGEFWLGNDNLHRLTAQGEYELRVDLSDFESESRYALYDSFGIADLSDMYRLTLGRYSSGTAGIKSVFFLVIYLEIKSIFERWMCYSYKLFFLRGYNQL